MVVPLPPRARRMIKGRLKQLRLGYARWRHGFDAQDFAVALHRVGVRPGDTLIVHSSYDRFVGFTGKATDVIGALQAGVHPHGSVLMPTIPFTGTAVDYVKDDPVFDVRRTPSRMGILSELFRRMPDVQRSVHPTHSVAGWGSRATGLLADHYRASTPCGVGSPYQRLVDAAGCVLLLGTGIGALTLFHAAEDALEPRMPFSPFTSQRYRLLSRTATGDLVETNTRLFDPDVSRRRNLTKLVPALKAAEAWRETHVGDLQIILLGAADVMKALGAMADGGSYCYD